MSLRTTTASSESSRTQLRNWLEHWRELGKPRDWNNVVGRWADGHVAVAFPGATDDSRVTGQKVYAIASCRFEDD